MLICLYNNQKNVSKPLVVADNLVGEWNTFHIIMKGDKVTVYLNGILVTDNTPLENFWNRKLPLFAKEQIELQAHGTFVSYRNIYLRELPPTEPYKLNEQEIKIARYEKYDSKSTEIIDNYKVYISTAKKVFID